jgi:hypothetical protein
LTTRQLGYASGGGHFLSRRAAAVIAEKLTHADGADDQLVSKVMAAAGISLVIDNDHFRVLCDIDEHPGPENEYVYTTPRIRESE